LKMLNAFNSSTKLGSGLWGFLDGYESLRLGTQFETNLAGQDVFASVQEFEPMTRIAWGG